MTGLTVGTRAALAQVIEAIPDDALGVMRSAVAQMGGERADELAQMLEETIQDRRRRATAFGALVPLFRSRRDGLAFLAFPSAVLPRLWRASAGRGASFLSLLDGLNDEDSSRRALARARLYALAAEIVRQQPDLIWPPVQTDEAATREAGLVELAACCDMGVLAHAAVHDLADWIDRPSEDRLAEFRLMVRDASALDLDGVRRLLDIMAAHVDDASRILRLTAHAGGIGSGVVLKHSELSVIVERIIDGFVARATRTAAFRTGEPIDSLRRDLEWIGSVLDALTLAVKADPNGEWARRVGASRAAVAGMIDDRLQTAPRAIGKIMPMRDAATAGRMTRRIPRLDIGASTQELEAAAAAADLIAAVRFAANRFGCEGRRQTVLTGLIGELSTYADLAIETMNSADGVDFDLASARVAQVADLLERLEAETEARTARRRLAALRPSAADTRAA